MRPEDHACRISCSRSGLTMLEVMIAAAVMVMIVVGSMAHLATLGKARQEMLQQSQAQQLISVLMERVHGAAWSDLEAVGWAEPRFSYGTAVNPPLADNGLAEDSLQSLGLLLGPSGIPQLKIYVEYYTGEILEDVAITDHQTWEARLAGYRRDAGTAGLTEDLTIAPQYRESVVMRFVVTWDEETAGVPKHRHTVTTVRKK